MTERVEIVIVDRKIDNPWDALTYRFAATLGAILGIALGGGLILGVIKVLGLTA